MFQDIHIVKNIIQKMGWSTVEKKFIENDLALLSGIRFSFYKNNLLVDIFKF